MGIDLLEQEIANETSEPVRDLNREVNGNGILEMTEIDQAQYPEEPFTNELTENNVPVLRHRGEGSSRAVRSSQSKTNDIHTNNSNSEYECNICFDTASSPVLTLCGHLFCWPCLHQWLEAQYQNPLCPVCKAGCGQDKVIPIYGRGKEAKDPRKNSDIPNRPAGQRPQPQRDPNQPGAQFFPVSSFHSNAFGPHFSISASAIFPSLFGAQFTFPPPNGPPSPQQAFVSRLLLMLAILFSLCFYFIR